VTWDEIFKFESFTNFVIFFKIFQDPLFHPFQHFHLFIYFAFPVWTPVFLFFFSFLSFALMYAHPFDRVILGKG